MEPYGSISKGAILFEEKKMSNLVVLLLALVGYVATFVLYFLSTYRMYGDPVGTAIGASMMTFMIAALTLPFLLMRRYPLAIYEKGLDAPISAFKFLQRRTRFVEFSNIKSIHPEYADIFGTSKLGGYSIITAEGTKVDIRDVDENKLRTVRDTLESALKDRWNSLYADTPYLGFEELQRLREQLARSKKGVWIEGLGVIFFLFGFCLVSAVVFRSFLLIIIVTLVSFFGILAGVSRIRSYYAALVTYRKAIERDPSLEKLLSTYVKVEIREKDPLKTVEKFREEDWKRLESSIHDIRPWYLILAGFLVMVVAVISEKAIPYMLFSIVLFSGIVVMMSSLLLVSRITKNTGLVKSLIERELRQGRRILPDWFKIKHGVLSMLPFREAPRYSDKQWRNLVRASKIRDERRMAALSVLLVSSMLLSIVLPKVLGLSKYVAIAMLGIFMSIFVGYGLVNGGRAAILQAILAFEEQSGQKAVPEQYRSQMFKGWRLSRKS